MKLKRISLVSPSGVVVIESTANLTLDQEQRIREAFTRSGLEAVILPDGVTVALAVDPQK